jgi:hypothetical protein
MDKAKNILTSIVGFLTMALFSILFYQGKIIWWHFLSLMIGLGIFLIFYFNYDRVEELLVEFRKLKIFVKTSGERLGKIKMKIGELRARPEDLKIHVEEKISAEEGKVNVRISPVEMKLQSIVDDMDDFVAEAEKQLSGKVKRLSGKAEAKSDVLGDLTGWKNKEVEMAWEKIKCYLCENEDVIMKPDPQGGPFDEIIRCPTCKFYQLPYPIKKYYFETKLLTKQDKEKLSLNIQKDYDPKKEDEPVQITREMIKKKTGKESVGYR